MDKIISFEVESKLHDFVLGINEILAYGLFLLSASIDEGGRSKIWEKFVEEWIINKIIYVPVYLWNFGILYDIHVTVYIYF